MSIEPPSHYPREISVTEPLTAALDRVKLILFQPFDLGKWFTIGFCAWLAGLGERGGYSYSNHTHFNNGNTAQPLEQFRQIYDHAHDYVLANLTWLIPVVVVAGIILLGLGVLFLWLNCRGKFMFLHCVALNRAEVVIPWDQYAAVANSLFWFRLVLSLAGMVLVLPLVVILIVLVIRLLLAGEFGYARIMPIVGVGLGLSLLMFVLLLVQKFLVDFVVPILYLRGGTCLAAWREFGRLLADQAGCFALYLLFQIVLLLALVILILFAVLATCCLAGCLMILPYLGTVVLLPVLVFKRAYALYFLAQLGPAYDVFPPVTPPLGTPLPPGLQPV